MIDPMDPVFPVPLPKGLLPAAVLFLASALGAQQIERVSLSTAGSVSAVVGARGVVIDRVGVPARTDVTSGLDLEVEAPGAGAAVRTSWSLDEESFSVQLYGQCAVDGAQLRGATAEIDTARVVLEMHLTRPMTLRLVYSAGVIVSEGVSARAAVDLGDDGVHEVDFRSATCDSRGHDVVVDVPAGPFRFALEVEAGLAAEDVNGPAGAAAVAVMHIEPAHVTVDATGSWCGASIEAEPLLDGDTVRFRFGPVYPGGMTCLLLGIDSAQEMLPLGANCPLQIVPIAFVPALHTSETQYPISSRAMLGCDWLAQTVALFPASPWHPGPTLHSSAVVRVRPR